MAKGELNETAVVKANKTCVLQRSKATEEPHLF
jgi:hypothetical protein